MVEAVARTPSRWHTVAEAASYEPHSAMSCTSCSCLKRGPGVWRCRTSRSQHLEVHRHLIAAISLSESRDESERECRLGDVECQR